jgi:hypothetical protein
MTASFHENRLQSRPTVKSGKERKGDEQEVIELILEEQRSRGETVEIEPFVGIQQIAVEV